MQARKALSSRRFSQATDSDEGVDESGRSDILCSVEQMKNREKIKKRLRLEGTLDAAVPLKIAALDTIVQMNVNKQRHLSKKVRTLNWIHLIIFRIAFLFLRLSNWMTRRFVCESLAVSTFMFKNYSTKAWS